MKPGSKDSSVDNNTKRLFIGGLHPDVTEEQLTKRFSKFGKISTVDVKTKSKDNGEHDKTFAYVTIESDDAQIKKCMSIFNKSKWRGFELKIEVAKENFLDRLQKEREKKMATDTNVKKTPSKTQSPPPLFIKGKNNQTIKVGQSKSKKTFSTKDESVANVDDLTWLMDEKEPPSYMAPSKKHNDKAKKVESESDSSSSEEENSSSSDEKAVKQNRSVKQKKGIQVKKDSSEDEESSEDETDEDSPPPKKIPHSSQKQTFHNFEIVPVRKSPNNDSDDCDSDDTDEIIASAKKPSTPQSNIANVSSSNSTKKSSQKQKRTSSSKDSDNGIELPKKGQIKMVPFKGTGSLSNDNDDDSKETTPKTNKKMTKKKVSSDSSDSSDEESVDKAVTRKTAPPKPAKASSSSDSDSSDSSIDYPSMRMPITRKPAGPQLSDDQKRKLAFLQRQKEVMDKKKAISMALKSLDSAPKGNKIVFHSDDDDDSEDDKMETDVTPVTKGSESGLQLFNSDSSSEDEEMDEDKMFQVKPQFQGEAGEKLMALQQRFKGDERFKIDERFLELEDKDLAEEKPEKSVRDRDLEILASMLGTKAKSKSVDKYREKTVTHFDPSRAEHKEYEIQPEESKPKKSKKKKEIEEQSEEIIMPEVSKERYFEVTTDLKDIFAQQDASTPVFSFLSNRVDTMEEGEEEEDKIPEKAKTTMLVTKTPLDTSSSSEDEMEALKADSGNKTSPDKVTKFRPETFFFTTEDQRIADGTDFFCCKKSIEVVRSEWEEKRPNLVESYRSKRKKAIRKHKFQDTSSKKMKKHNDAS